jgi:hypothetical protein
MARRIIKFIVTFWKLNVHVSGFTLEFKWPTFEYFKGWRLFSKSTLDGVDPGKGQEKDVIKVGERGWKKINLTHTYTTERGKKKFL